jgi:KDO2-lipid IV(A) lauroyltransferase
VKRWKPYWRRVRFLLISALLIPLGLLPRGIGCRLFGGIGLAASRVMRGPRQQIVENTRLIFPDWTPAQRLRFAREVLRAVARNGFDFLRLRRYSLKTIERIVAVEGLENLERARRTGRGVVCLGAHLGCWELIPFRLRSLGYSVGVVYRRLADPVLDAYVAARRSRFEIATYDRDTGGRGMLRCLKRGACLGVLVDQHTRVDSMKVPFLGHDAWTPTGAVRLAMRVGVPMVPFSISMRPDGTHLLRIGPEVRLEIPGADASQREIEERVRENTAHANDVLGRMILDAKEQWVWFHRRWRDL